jgi:16S rRNA (guanine966-N2)-methyltransferase
MTRIIAGFAGSLRLAVPRSGTRPTSDRVREAVFSALEARGALQHANVLDLYAGSGAVGLEAASRGADVVVLVERAHRAVEICRRNAAAVLRAAGPDPMPKISVNGQSVQAYLEQAGMEFDVAFVDPPYDLDENQLARNLEFLAPRLHEDAIVVVERSARSPEPRWPEGIAPERRKDYGETTLWWASAAADANPTAAQPAAPSQPE